MFDEETERMKRRIRERLASYSYYDHYCIFCGRYLCRITRQLELTCFDCWRLRRSPPPPKPLLLQLIDEINSRNRK